MSASPAGSDRASAVAPTVARAEPDTAANPARNAGGVGGGGMNTAGCELRWGGAGASAGMDARVSISAYSENCGSFVAAISAVALRAGGSLAETATRDTLGPGRTEPTEAGLNGLCGSRAMLGSVPTAAFIAPLPVPPQSPASTGAIAWANDDAPAAASSEPDIAATGMAKNGGAGGGGGGWWRAASGEHGFVGDAQATAAYLPNVNGMSVCGVRCRNEGEEVRTVALGWLNVGCDVEASCAWADTRGSAAARGVLCDD